MEKVGGSGVGFRDIGRVTRVCVKMMIGNNLGRAGDKDKVPGLGRMGGDGEEEVEEGERKGRDGKDRGRHVLVGVGRELRPSQHIVILDGRVDGKRRNAETGIGGVAGLCSRNDSVDGVLEVPEEPFGAREWAKDGEGKLDGVSETGGENDHASQLFQRSTESNLCSILFVVHNDNCRVPHKLREERERDVGLVPDQRRNELFRNDCAVELERRKERRIGLVLDAPWTGREVGNAAVGGGLELSAEERRGGRLKLGANDDSRRREGRHGGAGFADGRVGRSVNGTGNGQVGRPDVDAGQDKD